MTDWNSNMDEAPRDRSILATDGHEIGIIKWFPMNALVNRAGKWIEITGEWRYQADGGDAIEYQYEYDTGYSVMDNPIHWSPITLPKEPER